jgi:hypothetical protein
MERRGFKNEYLEKQTLLGKIQMRNVQILNTEKKRRRTITGQGSNELRLSGKF